MATAAIVILNFNGKHFIEKFLPNVIQCCVGHKIVVADNRSTDGSVDFLRGNFPQVHLIEFNENLGFCLGYNKALGQIDADFYVILNSDVELTPGWLDPILELFQSDSRIAAVQPKLLDYQQKEKFEYAGGAGGFIDKYGYPFCRGRIFDAIETDVGQYDDTREIFWATGACFVIRADVFHKYQGFDADFFAHMEEIDLCWRLKRDGHKIYHCGHSVAYHVGGGTLPHSNPMKTYLNFRNSLLVLIKNLAPGELWMKLFFRWLIDYLAIMKFFGEGKWRDAMAIFKAHFYILKNFKCFYRKRQSHNIRFVEMTGVYDGFLLYQFHIAGVRKFGNLSFH